MTIRFRRFIFWVFVILFIIASIIIILFAQGWRLDFKNFKIVKIGGIFIKTSVTNAKIYIDDNYVGSTAGILNYARLIGNLVPKNYNIFIYKEGYYPWNKTVEVKNGLVTELFYITLFPLDLKKNKIAELPVQTLYNFSINENIIKIINAKKSKTAKLYDVDGNFISVENFSATNGPATGWKIATSTEITSSDENKKLHTENNKIFIDYLSDTKKEPYKKAGEKELIAVSESPILFSNWLKDSEHVMWLTTGELTITEIDNRGGKRNSIKFYLNINPPVFWNNKNFDLYFFESSKTKLILYKINIE